MLKNETLQKNSSIVLLILLALLLMAIVYWVFEKRIRRIEDKRQVRPFPTAQQT
jgi:cbb3-type cytochrome oxidase subunit 3